MKCKYGRYDGYVQNVMGIVDLDNLDITDLNFINASSDTIYFFNIVEKLTKRGITKMLGLGFNLLEYNTDNFIYILPDEPLTDEQKIFSNKKQFIDAFKREVEPYIDDNDREITDYFLEKNDWEAVQKYTVNCLDYETCYQYYIADVCNLSLYKDESNMIGRDWTLHIDNANFETTAVIDIQTVDQFNKAMELMDIDYHL